MKTKLTIYILSYNLPEQVAITLDSLLPFDNVYTKIIIGDNSDFPYSQEIENIVNMRKESFNNQITYVKHKVNLGASSNALRAFEVADSEFLWIVSCKNRFMPNALTILEPILDNSNATFLSFLENDLRGGREFPKTQRKYDNFFEALCELELGPVTSINFTIYRVDRVSKYVALGYYGISCLAPHLVIIVNALDDETASHYLEFYPVQIFERLPHGMEWDVRQFWGNLGLIYPRPQDEAKWQKVREEIIRTHSNWVLDCFVRYQLPITTGFIEKTIGQFGDSAANFISRLQEIAINRQAYQLPQKTTMKKHILLYTDDPGLGGVAQHNHSLMCGFVQLSYQVTCVQSEYNNHLVEIRKQLGIQHIWLDFDTLKDEERKVTDTESAQRILSEIKPDLIIFGDSWALANLGAKQVAIQYNIPFIAIIGLVGVYPGGIPSSSLKLMSEVYNYAKAVIAVSENNLNLLHQGYGLPENKGEVIYCGRPKEFFTPQHQQVRESLRQQLNIPQDAIVCFTAGRYDKIKGYDYQLAAIEQLKLTEIWDKLYFIWVGSGPKETELKQKINQQKLTDKIKLLGQRLDVPDLLDSSDIFILPSLLEGLPLTVMEAMAKGLPVIASTVSGIPEELGNTGQLIADPNIAPETTINQLVETIKLWASNEELRHNIGRNCQQRARELFTEERMINQTKNVIERALLPVGDYVSPKLEIVRPDAAFPNMIIGDPNTSRWLYFRREIPHNWYVDQRSPYIGFVSRDEASILYNNALQFQGKKALEIGCWFGWSACHLALAGVQLDVIDPILENPDFYQSVSNSLQDAGVIDHVNLIPGYSPEKVHEIVQKNPCKWSLIFIDGNHEKPYPLNDAIACEPYAEKDAMILFHDLTSPDVAEGLDYLRSKGWNTLVYQTMQIMGVAWRGNVTPIKHIPDPNINWQLPAHLQTYPVSGLSDHILNNKKALIFFPHNPYPAKSGAHQRCLSLINALQSWGYHITLCGWDIMTDQDYPDNPQDLEIIESALNLKVFVYHGTDDDYNFIQANKNNVFAYYCPPGLKQFFGELFDQLSPELVIVNYSLWGELVNEPKFKQVITVLDSIDLYTLNKKMKGMINNLLSSSPYHPDQVPAELLREDYFSSQKDLQADQSEYNIFDLYDYTLAIAPQESSAMRSHTQNTQVLYVPMTYQPVYIPNTYQEKPIFAVGPNNLNIQGYLYFTKQILPQILAVNPDFKLQVVGMICKDLSPMDGVELSGFVPDLTAVYTHSCFAICPLIGGTGQQVKIVEAMAHSLPVIALINVADSSPIQHGVNGFIANNAEEFAQYCLQLWQDRKLCETMGIAARNTIDQQFSPQVIKDKLSPIVQQAKIKALTAKNQVQQNNKKTSLSQPIILIDGVFFQLYKTGIARVWKSLLEVWANTDFAQHIVVLDRDGTAPFIPGINYYLTPRYDYKNTEGDRQTLQKICDAQNAKLFISSYYTTPITTPSIFMGYDMIPEVLKWDLTTQMWQEKHHGINNASAYITISQNTKDDLIKFFPSISEDLVTVAYCGASEQFTPATLEEIKAFQYKYGIRNPYFLIVSMGKYKNTELFLQAFNQLPYKQSFDIVCTGGQGSLLPDEWRQYTAGSTLHNLQLNDDELRLAYSGAIALVYPSKYEGFGMPIAEAMACGCPVITCANASIPEVGEDAVLYVKDDDINEMNEALCDVQKPRVRQHLINAGIAQSKKFSWLEMANIVSDVLLKNTLQYLNLREINLIIFPDWLQSEDDLYTELAEVIRAIATDPDAEQTTLLIDISNTNPENADLILSSIAMNLMIESELDISEILQISVIEKMSESQWETLLPLLHGRIILERENQQAIALSQAENLPYFEIEKKTINSGGLNQIIPPEIKDDPFYDTIQNLVAQADLTTILEMGSSAGGGSTEAFVTGITKNPKYSLPKLFCMEVSEPRFQSLQNRYENYDFVKCYHVSSVTLDQFPTPETVTNFYHQYSSGLNNYPLEMVLGWLQQDLDYVTNSGLNIDGINLIKKENNIEKFDLVLIDGSEFTGEAEFKQIYGAKYILLDDTNTYKNYHNYRKLLTDPNYELIEETLLVRNGYAVFKRIKDELINYNHSLPIHFFTIVLNGQPFIQYHLNILQQLPFKWHWHIIEGVADLKHDTAWSLENGGTIVDEFHNQGLSKDGTSEYLDEISQLYPKNITIYRKPQGVFWDGKIEMVNAPLPNIKEECLLWQIDVDELWTIEQICTTRKLFLQHPEKTAAFYWCWYFVGENLIISTRNCYAEYPQAQWLRTWKFTPGDDWESHEPPNLVRKIAEDNIINVGLINPFLHDENEKNGLVFQHFAYILPSQLRFKELYYGYQNAVNQWQNLQQTQSFPVLLRNYFAWVWDNTLVGSAKSRGIIPLFQRDFQTNNWRFISPVEYEREKQEDMIIRNSLEYLNLREINLIMFPDWNQSEDDLYAELAEVISAIILRIGYASATSPNGNKATLLIDISNSNPENVELILSSIAMNLMMEEEIDMSEILQISLIDNLSSIQWEKLLPMVNGRIILNKENQEAIAFAKAENLPDFQIENNNNTYTSNQ